VSSATTVNARVLMKAITRFYKCERAGIIQSDLQRARELIHVIILAIRPSARNIRSSLRLCERSLQRLRNYVYSRISANARLLPERRHLSRYPRSKPRIRSFQRDPSRWLALFSRVNASRVRISRKGAEIGNRKIEISASPNERAVDHRR